MYHEHQPTISAWARAHPDHLARVVQFCVISARQKFYNVPALIQEAGQPDSGALYGWKHRAFQEAWDQREEVHWHCEDIWELGDYDRQRANYLLAYLSTLHGLNVAKAGFACQLAYGVSGCLDSVNNQRLRLPPRFCANFSQLKTRQGRLNRAQVYNHAIYQAGGTASLWNAWCAAMSERYPEQFPTADAASALHLECLGVT